MNDKTYSREALIAICERSFVPQKHWRDRDTSAAQRQLGEAYALLKAGCGFRVLHDGTLATTDRTIWVEIKFKGFGHFDYGGGTDAETYYLPTAKRLDRTAGKDWY